MAAAGNSYLTLSLMAVTEETLALDEHKLVRRHVVITNTAVVCGHLNLK
jgi:hypothetical protein